MPFVLSDTHFPFSVSVSPFLSRTKSNNNNKATTRDEEKKTTAANTPTTTTPTATATTTPTSSTSSLFDEDHSHNNVEVVHSTLALQEEEETSSRDGSFVDCDQDRYSHSYSHSRSHSHSHSHFYHHSDNNSDNNSTMSLQLDRYGFITNIDNKGQIFETNGIESIQVPSFAESQRTDRREKKWNTTLQSWDNNNRQKQQKNNKTKNNQNQNQQSNNKSLSSLPWNKNKDKKLPLVQRKQIHAPSSNKALIRRLRKGVPDSIRGRVWTALGGGIKTPGMYQKIIEKTSDAMLENCRQVQGCTNNNNNDYTQTFDIDNDNNYGGGDRTPERGVNNNDNDESNSNRTSPTNTTASEVSSSATPPPSKGKSTATTTADTDTTNDKEIKTSSSGRSSPTTTTTTQNNNTNILSSEEEKENYATTRDFRNLQDIIERDIHRTYPRHNLFYEEERDTSPLQETGVPCGDTDSLLSSTVLCDPELAAMILNLETDIRMVASGGAGETSTTDNDAALQQYSINDNTQNNNCVVTTTTQGGQAALRRVLRAYSYYDPEVGYCQGMNFIAGMFLTQMNEEEAFWLLVSVMHDKPCKMGGLFGEGMRDTHKVLFVAEKLIHHYLSRLARHFDKEHVHLTMYATQWLLTQFTSNFKFDLVFRVWDAFLGEGWKIIYRVMLALMQKYQSQLLKMSFEEILTFFRELPTKIEGNQIMDMALKIPLRKKVMDKYEKEWESQQQQQEQHQ